MKETESKQSFYRDRKRIAEGRDFDMADIAIIGAGSWGTALALVLNKNGHHVTIWSYLKEEADEIREKRENPSKLPGVHIPEEIEITTDLQGSVEGKDVVVLAVPSMATRATAKKMCPYVKEEQILVNVAKGIEEGTLKTLSEQIEEEIPQANVAVLSGPSHAEEVSRELPTTVVVGAETEETAIYLQKIFMNDVFRVYTSPDIKGIELGGSLKNVIALAAGVADGLGYGDNTKAALITRGIAEITRLGVKMGGKAETFSGLTGIGDLIVTCASVHSRNRKAGYLIGQGKSMQEAMDEVGMIVEGVYSAKAAIRLAQKYQAPVFTHLAETEAEVEGCKERYGMTPLAFLDSIHMFDYGGGIYHGVHMTEEDLRIMKKRGLCIVTNPASNLKLASGIAPVTEYLKLGIPVAIGTDGPASNNCLDMFREMFLVTGLAKVREMDASAVDAKEVLKMATVNGAHAMGLKDCDVLAAGKYADMIRIDLKQPNMQPIHNICKNLVYSGSKANVKMTMVNGKILYENGVFAEELQARKIYQTCEEITRKLCDH